MSVVSPLNGEGFVITIVKSLVANPAVRWRNTYEAFFTDGGEPLSSVLLDFAEKLLDFEQQLHLTGVQFVQTTISTYLPETADYDPESFVTIPHPADTIGERTIGASQPLDLTAAFYVRRQVPTGRQGKLFYRGVLGENDVEAPAGRMRLTSVSNMQSLVDDALTSSGLNEHLYPLSTGNLMLSMTSTRKDGSVIHRQVMGLVAAGATRVSNDHRWYDVSAPEQA
jgi:hypothetical protein